MKLVYEGTNYINVSCKGNILGNLYPNFYVRREKSVRFYGCGMEIFYNSVEDAKNKLPQDLTEYFKKLMEEENV